MRQKCPMPVIKTTIWMFGGVVVLVGAAFAAVPEPWVKHIIRVAWIETLLPQRSSTLTRGQMRSIALAKSANSSAFADTKLFVPKEVDVGRLRVNQPVKFKFAVKNSSTEEIAITRIKTSCPCAAVKLEGDMTLEAGGERIMTGTINFGSDLGRDETRVVITYQDKRQQVGETVVPIRGKVIAAAVLNQASLDFGAIDMSAGPQALIVKAKRGNSGEEWDSIRATSTDAHVVVASSNNSADVWQVAVQLSPSGLPISTFRGAVTLQLLHHDTPLPNEIELPITGRITGPIRASPGFIYLGVVSPGQRVERLVSFSSSVVDLRELEVEGQPEGVEAKFTNLASGSAKLSVSVVPGRQVNTFSQTLSLLHPSSGLRVGILILGAINGDSR